MNQQPSADPSMLAQIRRARLHDALRPWSTPRTSICRKRRIAPQVQVKRTPQGKVVVGGVCTCGSPWGCPSCATAVYTKRASEVTRAATEWCDSGGFLYLMTNTLRHAWNDDLKVLRTGLSKAFSGMFAGRSGHGLRARINKVHHIRSIEVTYGKNGYHPHVHTLLFLDRELDASDRKLLAETWNDCVAKELGTGYVPDDEHGTMIDESHRTDYIAKLGLEVAAITTKDAKNGNRTMWAVAADAANGCKGSAQVWKKYVHAMFGCRQLFWSKGAKCAFRIQRMTDEQIVADGMLEGEPIGVATVLAQWDGMSWDKQARANKFWYTNVIANALQGAASLAELPDQQRVTPIGHIAVKRFPLNYAVAHYPVPLSQEQEQDIEQFREKRARAGLFERAAFDAWLRERGIQSLQLTALQYSQQQNR